MDAFSVSLADGLANKDIKKTGVLWIAGTFAVWQFCMPMIGWFLVRGAANFLTWFENLIPWMALILLLFIGIKMLMDAYEERKSGADEERKIGADNVQADKTYMVSLGNLTLQGLATSIDALSVGFTTSAYGLSEALASSLIIGLVTFAICVAGVLLGRRLGTALSWKASVLGGIILIIIGIKIFLG